MKNEWEPTIQNIYKAAHSGVATKGNEEISVTNSEGQTENRKGTSLTKEETKLLFKRNGSIKEIKVSVSL